MPDESGCAGQQAGYLDHSKACRELESGSLIVVQGQQHSEGCQHGSHRIDQRDCARVEHGACIDERSLQGLEQVRTKLLGVGHSSALPSG